MTDIVIPEDLEQLILDILAQQAKEEEEECDHDNPFDRLYIEDILPDIDKIYKKEEEDTSWKIEIKI